MIYVISHLREEMGLGRGEQVWGELVSQCTTVGARCRSLNPDRRITKKYITPLDLSANKPRNPTDDGKQNIYALFYLPGLSA